VRDNGLHLSCVICGAPWPHRDNDHRASCVHAMTVTQWRAEDYMDVTNIGPVSYGIDVPTMLRCAGVELRQLPGRPDRIWGPAWAVQVACTVGDLKQEQRVRWIEKVYKNDELRAAAEAICIAGEFVLEVMREAVTL
jgi:hypothetical protein